jgi:hypothetical protein
MPMAIGLLFRIFFALAPGTNSTCWLAVRSVSDSISLTSGLYTRKRSIHCQKLGLCRSAATRSTLTEHAVQTALDFV